MASRYPGHLVLGADQMLDCDGDGSTSRRQGRRPSGTVAARSVAQAGFHRRRRDERSAPVAPYRHRDLTITNLSDDFIDRYLDEMGDAVLSSVGAYQLEGLGAQLFNRIEGDYFTILGAPLLPVLVIAIEAHPGIMI